VLPIELPVEHIVAATLQLGDDAAMPHFFGTVVVGGAQRDT
jgi:hypothetical protein